MSSVLAKELFDLAEESVAQRALCAGRPVVDHAAFAMAQNIRAILRPLARAHRLNGEARGVAAFDTMLGLRFGAVRDIAEDIERIVPEYRCGDRGRVDRALFHRSGAISLVEVKDGGSPRDIVAGIGQVAFYKAIVERTTDFAPINGFLAVLHEHDEDIARACSIAGVGYVPLGRVSFVRALSAYTDLVCGTEGA